MNASPANAAIAILASVNMKSIISKKSKFSELMKHPEAIEILMEKGMHCFGCPMAMQENIEQGAKAHGIDADELIKEINKKLGKKK